MTQEQRNKAIQMLIDDFKPQIKVEQPIQTPLLSIVTIYDEQNEAKWLCEFIENLPKVQDGIIEVILCKNVRDGATKERPKAPELRNGIIIHYVMHYFKEWNFADARNVAQTAASGKWILALDTDEMLIPNQVQTLIELCENGTADAYSLKAYSLLEGDKFDIAPVTRLFKNNEKIVWRCGIHETVLFSIYDNDLKHEDTNITIFHAGYNQDKDVLIKKLSRNLDMICREYAKTTHSHMKNYLKLHLTNTVKELERYEQENRD